MQSAATNPYRFSTVIKLKSLLQASLPTEYLARAFAHTHVRARVRCAHKKTGDIEKMPPVEETRGLVGPR
jgi:hypothetical protein